MFAKHYKRWNQTLFMKSKFRKNVRKQVRKVKGVRLLVPGILGYEYYKTHKKRGNTKLKSAYRGAKAEAVRLAATASFPLPGTYELTTVGLAKLKKRIEKGEVDDLTLKSMKTMNPLRKVKKKEVIKGMNYRNK